MIAPGSALSFRPRRIIGEINRKKSLLFVNKKKQKNFVNLEIACNGLATVGSEPFEQKFFASFFQKRCFSPWLAIRRLSLRAARTGSLFRRPSSRRTWRRPLSGSNYLRRCHSQDM